jgi:hypothetical protein
MKTFLFFYIFSIASVTIAAATEPAQFNTQWIPSKPEVLTYRSTSSQGDGLYQVSISKGDSGIEIYMNIISPGFTKTVSGTMTSDMRPLQSKSKIIVNGQVIMDTKCIYESDRLSITTVMMPYNQTTTNSPSFSKPVIDFSQVPLLARTLSLEKGSAYTFTSLNPQTNTLIPLTVKVTGEGSAQEVDCYKVEVNDFEGLSIYWVEKGSRHRVIRVEQPGSHRTTELLQ